MSFFPKVPPISLIFLWLVVHFINAISCILDLTNSLRKIGSGIETDSAFKLCLPSFAKWTVKIALTLPVLKKSHNFDSVPTLNR